MIEDLGKLGKERSFEERQVAFSEEFTAMMTGLTKKYGVTLQPQITTVDMLEATDMAVSDGKK